MKPISCAAFGSLPPAATAASVNASTAARLSCDRASITEVPLAGSARGLVAKPWKRSWFRIMK